MITALAGGVGAARFLQGLTKLIPEEDLTIIINTGDDIEFYGLHISPDLDIVMYTLSGIVDEEKGWGVKGDTFNCLQTLKKYGCETWFKLGDKDLATHIHRTALLKGGLKLSQVARRLVQSLGLRMKILPMTDDRVETIIVTEQGEIHFQEYLVKRGSEDEVVNVEFKGMDKARPAPGVVDSISNSEALIVCPSNPIVSIGPIIRMPEVMEALMTTKGNVVGISPIVAGATIKGPADKLMSGLGLEVSAYGVAKLYKEFLDAFVIDNKDEHIRSRIEGLGMRVAVTNTIMRCLDDKVNLAKLVLNMIK